jgi:AbrB family looped-hinge helix DNA binding protein
MMTAKLTTDKAGRVVIPKKVRDKLHLAPGDELQLESEGEEIVLRPGRREISLRKKRGIWVAYGAEPLGADVTDAVLQSIRDERDDKNFGKM